MLERWAKAKIDQALRQAPAVALLGMRQVGKTTLAQMIGEAQDSLYLDLESPEDLAKLGDPLSFLSARAGKLIILDEIQRLPEIFTVLRGVIDKGRQAGQKGGQFLLLGSASMELMRQSSESLAGRIHYIHLSGLNALEVSGAIRTLWSRGGLPESYLASTDAQSVEWREMFIRTYLERDVPQMGFQVPAGRLRRLWTMLAHLQGETLNNSKLGANLEVDGKTVSSYLDILAELLLLRRLEPWHANVKKRLVKSPRFYIRDSGILHRLLGIPDGEGLWSSPVLGKSWEGFVIENILSVLPISIAPYYYRTRAGAEIDLVLKVSNRETWAIEIKHGLAPKVTSGFWKAAEDVGAGKKFIVYSGDDEFPIEKGATVISLAGLMDKIQCL